MYYFRLMPLSQDMLKFARQNVGGGNNCLKNEIKFVCKNSVYTSACMSGTNLAIVLYVIVVAAFIDKSKSLSWRKN